MGEGKYVYKKTKMPEVFENQALVIVKSSGNHPYSSIVNHTYEPKDIQIGLKKTYDKKSKSLKVHINS
jgi:hypothetical protein|tara:strand:+ start:11614 stop:11817 length:204 start_codon:yes stop_codon:yes gene_type:complete